MNYLILSSLFLAFFTGLFLVYRKGARGNRSDRAAYYTVRHTDADQEEDESWWVVIFVAFFLLGAADSD